MIMGGRVDSGTMGVIDLVTGGIFQLAATGGDFDLSWTPEP